VIVHSVWCGTFNVNDKQPKNGASDVQSWVDSTDGAEVLVFGYVYILSSSQPTVSSIGSST
jgi:hypothetical protein